MIEYINAECLMCGKTISVQKYQHENGAHPICIKCQQMLEDSKLKSLHVESPLEGFVAFPLQN